MTNRRSSSGRKGGPTKAKPRRDVAATPLDGRASRARIQDAIAQDPGLHVSEVAERTSLSWHTTIYHLHVLQRQGMVVLHKAGRDRAVFPRSVPARLRPWFVAVRVGHARVILASLLAGPPMTIPGLAQAMGVTKKVVRRRVADLEEAGLVERGGLWRPRYRVRTSAVPFLSSVFERGGGAPGGPRLGFWTLDPADCTAVLSSEACEVLGLVPRQDELLEDFVAAHVHPDDHPGLVAVVRGALAEGRPYEHTFRIRTHDGERVIRQRGWVGLRGADGRARQYSGTLEDVTLAHERPGPRRQHAKPSKPAKTPKADKPSVAHGLAVGSSNVELAGRPRDPLVPS